MRRFASDDEVWALVRRFEQCELSLSEFDHGCHLAVGMAYLAAADLEGAMARMRLNLQRFSAHHGKMGYHETMTRFWMLKLKALRHGKQLWQEANEAATRLANKDMIFKYYERGVLMSEAARQQWVEPDPGFDRTGKVR